MEPRGDPEELLEDGVLADTARAGEDDEAPRRDREPLPPGRRPLGRHGHRVHGRSSRTCSTRATSSVGQGRLEDHLAPSDRMGESQLPRVQCQPARTVVVAPVDGVADHRVTDVGEVHADLVGATGAQLHLQLGGVGVAGEDPEVGGRGPAPVHHRHPLAVLGIRPDRRLHGRGRLGETAGDERPVEAGQGALLELGGQVAMGRPPSWRPPADPRCRGPGDGRSRHAPPRRAGTRPCRAGGARRRASHPGDQERGGRPGRPACRSPRATRPRTQPEIHGR